MDLTLPSNILAEGARLRQLAQDHKDIPSFKGRPSQLLTDTNKTYTGPELRALIGAGKTWSLYRPYFVTLDILTSGNKIVGRPPKLFQLDQSKLPLILEVLKARRVDEAMSKVEKKFLQKKIVAFKATVDTAMELILSGDQEAAYQHLTEESKFLLIGE